jgi:hypothetical protein
MSLLTNLIIPTSRLPVFREAGASARTAVEVVGKGGRKKPMPLRNGADRDCNIVLPCKRADFRLVVRDERANRTFTGGNCK